MLQRMRHPLLMYSHRTVHLCKHQLPKKHEQSTNCALSNSIKLTNSLSAKLKYEFQWKPGTATICKKAFDENN